MANKRNYEWALASVIDGFFTQDKAGGVTQRVPFSLIVSSLQGEAVFQPLDADLTQIAGISGTGILTRTGPNTWAVVSAVAPTAHASSHHYGGGDQITGSSIAGFRISDAPRWAGVGIVAPGAAGDLDFRDTSAIRNFTIRLNTTLGQVECFSSTDAGASRSNRLILPRADASPVWIGLGLNVATGSIQVAGVDAITSARAGRFTGLRLTHLSSGQIPVCSDANGEITASGLTDDGTFLSSTRTLRLWNTMARSGNTWTDLQWAQNAEERVSILSSNGSGQYAYHQWVFAPADTEASGRVLGGMLWGQKLSGKSGSNPGLKAGMYAVSAGAGGPTGGFGARLALNYRPDNGNSLVDALRIGAFGAGTADAVEAAILLRALAGIDAGLATFQSSTLTQPGVDFNCSNASSQAHIRILNSAAGNLLGGGIGDVEFTFTSTNRLRIGTNANQMILGGGEIVIEGLHIKKGLLGDVSPRTGSAATAAADVTVAYTGTGGHTESMPEATGSGRILIYANAGTGTWTLDAAGSEVIHDGGSTPVGSVAIVANAVIRTRILQDIGSGVWMRLN